MHFVHSRPYPLEVKKCSCPLEQIKHEMRITIYASLRIQIRRFNNDEAQCRGKQRTTVQRSKQRFCETVSCLVLSVDLAELDCSVVN